MKPIKFKAKPVFVKKTKPIKEIIPYKSEKPNIEQDSLDEMEYIHKEFGKQKQKEVDSFHAQVDANYYFCVYFKTKEQKEEFIKNANLTEIFDKGLKYVSGQQFADILKISLTKIKLISKGMFKVSKRFSHSEWF